MSDLQKKYSQADENNRKLSAYRPLPPETLKSLREYYRVGLTYTSNALEGNSLTESETKVVIENGLTIEGKPLRDHYEAVGHAKAYDYIYNITEKEGLAEEDILCLHRLFYQQIDSEKAGHYRNVKVYISGSRYAVAAVSKIPSEMQKLVRWYNENEKKLHPVELAATLHQRFVFIHPFVDGNGRVARLLMNLALTVNDTVKRTNTSLLSKTEQAVLDAISTHPDYSYEQLAATCGVSRPTIARTIKSLQIHGHIRRVGSDKTGHWEVINEVIRES